MSVEQTITYLEMTDPGELAPGREPPRPLATELLERRDRAEAKLARETWDRIGEPFGWTGRSGWSVRRWRARLRRDQVEVWIGRVEGAVAGMFELEAQRRGDVEIAVFGLVPEFTGRGFGGAFLTAALRRAWERGDADGRPTRRVWLHTSSLDHPNALRNYEARGLRVFRRLERPRPMSLG